MKIIPEEYNVKIENTNNLKEWKQYCPLCEYHYSNFDTLSPNYSCTGSYLDLKKKCIFRNKN